MTIAAATVGLARRRGWFPWGAAAAVVTVLIVALMLLTVWWDSAVGTGHRSFQSAQILLTSGAIALLALLLDPHPAHG
ncbi:hypothetical protein [Tessaracoccus massiliensis]|uniref:hypothetical protein n=1 Tax=Tessaracoccus massiliensis TaxID=1522311 RepID=UPI0005908F19|nr:hypothetical protein [Tessaracoccus massiliensis]